MKKQGLLFLTAICLWSASIANEVLPYKIFKANGKAVSYEKMAGDLQNADIVFFGELHNNTINHWLELQVLKSLHQKHGTNLAVGLEMLEADNQLIIDEYLNGTIQERHLLKEAKLWDRYKTDYHPLVEFAKQQKFPVIASNIPQRYANLVYRDGLSALDQLSDEGKKVVAPLPVTVDLKLPGYADMIKSMGGHGHGSSSPDNIAYAQAVKDATMAHFTLKYADKKVFHVNGAYHTQNYEGIVWYINQYRPGLKIATIHVVEQDDLEKLEEASKNNADFIIVVPKDMTKSY